MTRKKLLSTCMAYLDDNYYLCANPFFGHEDDLDVLTNRRDVERILVRGIIRWIRMFQQSRAYYNHPLGKTKL